MLSTLKANRWGELHFCIVINKCFRILKIDDSGKTADFDIFNLQWNTTKFILLKSLWNQNCLFKQDNMTINKSEAVKISK